MSWLRDSNWGRAVVAFVVGGVAFAAVWLAGYPEAAYLGFVAAGVIWGANRVRRRSLAD